MLPTLVKGQRILVERLTHHLGGEPEIGDIVVFHPPVTAEQDYGGRRCTVKKSPGQPCPLNDPRQSEENFVKRVVAGPGDRLYIENGVPVVNGERADEDFTDPCGHGYDCDFREEITIPEDHYFMMGDNRGGSQDSRFWGPIPRDWIIGKAFFTYWPPGRVGIL